ncbi:MAG: VWA-like domain-containing protein [Treponema sp.]|nr:VWA-like domain-containing protein [Treponema sp.]
MTKKAQKIISAEERIQLVSDGWYIREPALFLTFMSHIFTANPLIRGIRSGQGRVEYNPAYLAALNAEEAEEALKTEMIRILLHHPYRWPPRNAEVSYIASNITLNEYYRFNSLPYQVSDFWDNPKYKKRNFEFYYREYLKLMRQQTGSMSDEQSGGKNSASGAGNSASNDSAGNSDSNNKTRNNASKDNTRNSGDKNSASKDNTRNSGDKNSASNDSAGNSGGENRGGETSARNAENAALWTNDDFMDTKVCGVIKFIQQNMLSWGTIPGALAQSILATLKPILDYRKVLSGFRATVLSSNMALTRFRPSRRYGFVYMGKKSRFTTRLLIGVDVSGSISDKEINLFYSTVNRFFKYGIEKIDVQQFDADLQGKPLLMKKARKGIQVKGRGGTCFQPIIDYFAANRNTYNGLIIFTDGYAPLPNISPEDSYRVLWICSNKQSYEAHQNWMSKQGRCCWIQA